MTGDGSHRSPGARIEVGGTRNFRDLGGYRTADGATVRFGRLFRSDHLNAITDDGYRTLLSLGLRTVLDLRMQAERERQPSRLPKGVHVDNLNPIGAAGGAQIELMEEIRAGRVASVTVEDIERMYIEMLERATGMFAAVVRTIGTPGRLPALFHCTAGKDRTGLVAALVLALVGVDDDTIVADFELTNVYRTPYRIAELTPELAAIGLEITNFLPMFEAPAPALRSALAWLRDAGGVDAYLVDACGLDRGDLAATRRALIADSPPAVDRHRRPTSGVGGGGSS